MRGRVFTGVMITALVLIATACGRSNSNVGSLNDLPRETNGFILNVVNDPAIAGSTAQSYDLSTERVGQDVLVHVNATGALNLKALYFELTYDAQHYRPVSVDTSKAMGSKSDLVCLQIFQEPGKVTYGQVLTNWDRRTGFTGNATIASVMFKNMPAAMYRAVSVAPSDAGSQSTLTWNSGTNTLGWYYHDTGDYNQNSQVGIDDLTPLGAHWLEAATPPPFPEADVLSVIDGATNGVINIGDLSPIGVNWHKTAVGGYNIYKSTVHADYPSPPTGANGATTALLGNVAFSAATGTPADRKHFTFVVAAPAVNNYYWVRPNDLAGGLGNDGIASTLASGLPPTVISTIPADSDGNVSPGIAPSATFSEAMDPLTISTLTFTLMNGAIAVLGNVTYLGVTATFTPLVSLDPDTLYTATITTGARDLAGNALVIDYVWTFTTAIVDLGAIAPFGSFGGGSGMTNQGIYTVVNGDIGTTGASTMITGFHDTGGDVYTETPLNIGQVNGTIYTAPPPPGSAEKYAIAAQAAIDAQIAYNNLSPASMPGGIDPGAGQLGGLTLAPGIYQAAGGTFQITGSDLTLDAQGDANAVWVFQTASSLTVGDTAPRSVNLINGALAKNVYWYVGSAATINAAGGGTMVGTIIAYAGVTFSTPDNVILTVLEGRAIGLDASVTLVNTIINIPH